MDYGTLLPQAKEQRSSAASDAVLVAGASGATIRVAYVFVTSATAGTITFESGASNLRFELYVGDNGGMTAAATEGQYLFATAAGESLTWTSDIAGEHFVSVLYQKGR